MEPREDDQLLAKAEPHLPSTPATASRKTSSYLGAACVAATLLGAAVVASGGGSTRSSGATELKGKHGSSHHSKKKVTGSIDFSVANSYGARPSLEHEYKFITASKFAEPYRTTSLEAFHSEGLELLSCSWNMEQLLSSDIEADSGFYRAGLPEEYRGTMDGVSISMEFHAPGQYHVDISCLGPDGVIEYQKSDRVSVYYVRRELRSMSTADRERYLDAFKLMSELSTEEGKKIYGEHYHSLDFFVTAHLNTAGARSHDKIHDGLGVVTQHIAITQAMETALQTIHPSITVPYWDYTIDSFMSKIKYEGLDYKIFVDNELWGADWFGNTSTTKHLITDGRWAYQKVSMANSSSAANLMSPYGYMRAPWNLNPSPFVTRYHKMCDVGPEDMYLQAIKQFTDYKWPTCATHWQLTYGYDSWYSWVWDSSYLPHGPVHSWIGGVGGGAANGGCDIEFDKLETSGLMSKNDTILLKMNMFGTLKNAWRYEWIEMPKYCSLDAGDDCSFKCNWDYNHDNTTIPAEVESILDGYEISSDDLTDEEKVQFVDIMFCDQRYWPGDHLEAASPVEASFWPIHPTLDRLVQFKEMVYPFHDKTWLTDGGSYCTTSSTSNCDGHHPYDLTFWPSVTLDNATGVYKREYKTNIEVREAVNADTYGMSYVYEHFLWKHCEREGYNFATGVDNETVTGDHGIVAMTDDNPLGIGEDDALLDDAEAPLDDEAAAPERTRSKSGRGSGDASSKSGGSKSGGSKSSSGTSSSGTSSSGTSSSKSAGAPPSSRPNLR